MLFLTRRLSCMLAKHILASQQRFTVQRLCSSQTNGIEIAPYLMNRTIPAVDILQKLTTYDAERLEFIKTEHQMFIACGKFVPSQLDERELLDLLCCKSLYGRLKYHEFRFKVEKLRESKFRKKQLKPEEEQIIEFRQKNVIFGLIRDKPIRLHCEDRVAAEIRNPDSSQMLIFDCSHEQEMRLADQKNLAKQFTMLLANNREMKPFPFHIVFTSVVPGTNQYHFMQESLNIKNSSNESECRTLENGLFTVERKHFQESDFGGRKLVYLTPNARRCFEPGEFDHEAAYVVGGIVDKAIRRPVTHAQARRTGVECVRLPIERYLDWKSGSKTLTLVAIHAILATAKSTNGDWRTALERNIPKRFLTEKDHADSQITSILRSI